MIAFTAGEWVVIIGTSFTSLTGMLVAIIAAIKGTSRSAESVAVAQETKAITANTNLVAHQVHDEVKTMNGQSLAQLGDAIETRRVEDIAVGNRSPAEKEHLKTAVREGVDDV